MNVSLCLSHGFVIGSKAVQARTATRFNEALNTSWGVLNPSRFLGRRGGSVSLNSQTPIDK